MIWGSGCEREQKQNNKQTQAKCHKRANRLLCSNHCEFDSYSSDFYLQDNGKPNKTFRSITQTWYLNCYTVMVQDIQRKKK